MKSISTVQHFLIVCLLLLTTTISAQESEYPFKNPDLPLEDRITDLISRLTLSEKVGMMKYQSEAVPRLGIPPYNWWNDCLHGVGRSTVKVTVYPQPIGMAATFDTELLHRVGDCISSEGRAIFNEDLKNGKTGEIYRGITYWDPNINIFRDPRWGRGHETYGEDPYLTGKIAAAFISGIEGDDPYYYKATSIIKHFAVHSGPETLRHHIDVKPSDYDLWDTYLPAFRTVIRETKVAGAMCAYNRLDGIPCCGNDKLLVDILRNQLGFKGYLVTDCWAVNDFYGGHKTHKDAVTAISDAFLAGTDLECGSLHKELLKAAENGLISEKKLNVSLKRDLETLFRIGLFDPQERVPYSKIGKDVIECQKHRDLARQTARESMVLLKNENGILPLDAQKIRKIAVIGPNADNPETQYGNYNGFPTEVATPLSAIRKRYGGRIAIDYIPGCGFVEKPDSLPSFQEVAARARKADIIIFIGGISPVYLEGEQSNSQYITGNEGFDGHGDRILIELPSIQSKLVQELYKTKRPIIFVNMSGSAIAFPCEKYLDAIVQAWYPGQAGDAVIDVIFGEYNPAGRLPFTVYSKTEDIPDFSDYSMKNRTYRYYKGDIQYPFGFGLSYSTFSYDADWNSIECKTGERIVIKGQITNTGAYNGDEVIQLYVRHPEGKEEIQPLHALKGFKRISLNKGETKQWEFTLTPEDLGLVDSRGNLVEKAGEVTIFIGGGQPGKADGIFRTITIKGDNFSVQ